MSDSTYPEVGERGTVNCAHCGWAEVQLGPRGGYVCPQCFHSEVPAGEPA